MIKKGVFAVLAVTVCLFTFAGLCGAQVPLNGALTDLKNVCDYTANDKELRVINATAFLIANNPEFITHNADGTYSISTEALVYEYDDNVPLCAGSYLFGDTHVPHKSGRTAFLIDSNKMMSAAHGLTRSGQNPFEPLNYLVVFRPSLISAGEGCTNFTWTNIPAEDVYTPNGVVDTNTFGIPPGGNAAYDYAVFELTRPVTNRLPLKIRRSGRAHVGDTLFSAGHPERTGEMVDTAAVMAVVDAQSMNTDGFAAIRLGDDIAYNMHVFYGSSGSPVYNEDADVVEFVVAHGTNNWLRNPDGPCDVAQQLQPSTDPDAPKPSSTNSPTVDIQSLVPRPEVLVAPIEYVQHILAIHDSNSTFSNPYTVTTARYDGVGNPIGGELIDVEKTSWPSNSGDPDVTPTLAPGFYNVPAAGLSFDINADISNVNSCGTWDYDLDVLDVTNSQDNIIRHHFEIGLREYSITPADDWVVNDIGPPYLQSKTYTLKNVRPTPTHVVVSQDGTLPHSNLILINGISTVAFDLGSAGSGTDTATFTLTIDPTVASGTTAGTEYQGRVAVYNQPFNCSVQSESVALYRYVNFKRGEQLFYSAPLTGLLPPPGTGQQYGTPVRFDFDMTGEDSTSCVSDINLYLGVPSVPGLDLAPSLLKLQLTGPTGFTGVLWSGNSIVAGSAYETTAVAADGEVVPAFYLDDQVAPPLGPTLLGAFAHKKLKGHWYLDVSTSNAGPWLVAPVQLDFTIGGICPNG